MLIVGPGNYFRRDVVRLNDSLCTVPTSFFSPLAASSALMLLFHLWASPKSISLRSRLFLLRKRKFSGLRSRWAIWWVWQ
jgi:hypothetical protein